MSRPAACFAWFLCQLVCAPGAETCAALHGQVPSEHQRIPTPPPPRRHMFVTPKRELTAAQVRG